MNKVFQRLRCFFRGLDGTGPGHCFDKVASGNRASPGPLGRTGPWMVVICLDCAKLEEWQDHYKRIL